jgi:predicted PurR-regulated permease PerM
MGNITVSGSSLIKTLLILFLVVAGLYYARLFLMPFAIGGVLATLFLPICEWLEGKRWPRGLAVMACVLILLTAISLLGLVIGWQVTSLSEDFPIIKQKAIETVEQVQEFIFNNLGITAKKQTQILKEEQPSLSDVAQVVAGSLASISTGFLFILVYMFGLLYYRTHIKHFLIKLTSSPEKKDMEQVFYRTTLVSQQYLVGLIKMIVCLWIMYGIGFSIIGVKNAIFFAVLCGVLEIIPYIGNITGTTITIFVSVAQGAGLPVVGGIIIIYSVVQLIQGWVLEPIIVGTQVKINAFAIIISLVIGEMIWGIPGIFLAIPIIAMFKIVCDHIEQMKPYGFLVGEVEHKKAGPGILKRMYAFLKKKAHS